MSENNADSPRPLGEGQGVRAVGDARVSTPLARTARVMVSGLRTGCNPYAQVMLTYVRRPLASIQARIAVVCMLVLLTFSFLSEKNDLLLLTAGLFLFVFCAMHIEEQCANSRAHLLPRFYRVHLTIAAGAVLIMVILIPAIIAWLAHLSLFCLVAGVVFLFGAISWCVLPRGAWLRFAGVVGTVSSLPVITGFLWSHQHSGKVIPAGFLLIGLGLTLFAVIRLIFQNKDAAERHLAFERRRDTDDPAWTGGGMRLFGLWDWLAERHMIRTTRHIQHASASWWSRSQRWRAKMVSDRFIWPLILVVTASVAVPGWYSDINCFFLFFMFSLLGFSAPPLILHLEMSWRRHAFHFESLLPVRRSDYLKQIGMAVAVRHSQWWIGLNTVALLGWLMLDARDRPDIAALRDWLVFSAACQVCFFGVIVEWWDCDSKSAESALFAVILVSVVLIFTGVAGIATQGPLLNLAVAAIFVILGLLLIGDAYRRWLTADID